MTTRKELYDAGIISTTDGEPKTFDTPAPDMEVKSNGQHPNYWILSESERAKGFIRPVRRSYRHVGLKHNEHPLRELTSEEHERYDGLGYVKYEEYPVSDSSVVGRFWTQDELDKIDNGCGTVTIMSQSIAETYATKPVGFYGSTMCVGCGTHLPVGKGGEFVWEGTDERVGT